MGVLVEMVALGPKPAISAIDIHRDLAENWPSLRISGFSENERVLQFQIDDIQIYIAEMPAPIPWSQLEGPCATTMLWKDAEKDLRRHISHLIVTATGEAGSAKLAALLTQVIASILGTCSAAIGVYWGSATLVIPANIFRQFAIQVLPYGPPIQIWIDFRVGKDEEGKTFGFTHGLDTFGLMEMVTTNATESPAELRERLWSLATYVLENGPIIKNGNTVGQDAKERIRVVYSRSKFGHEKEVMRLEYESV